MRYVLAAIFVCSLGMSGASALPALSSSAVTLSKADSFVQVAKRSKSAKASRQSRRANNSGIHPLVGSGDY